MVWRVFMLFKINDSVPKQSRVFSIRGQLCSWHGAPGPSIISYSELGFFNDVFNCSSQLSFKLSVGFLTE